jgi:plastocyanin
MRLFLYGFIFAVCLVFGFIFFAGCTQTSQVSNNSSSTTTIAGTTASVNIANFAFTPNPLTITVGTTVTWTNNDSTVHNVASTAGPASFTSGTLGTGSAFSFQFTLAGTYEYHCSIHPTMTGTITVQ